VENTLNGKELLPDQSSLQSCRVDKDAHSWMVSAAASPAAATCPDCGVRSTARHSSYLRHLRDLPVQGRPVKLMVRVARWRCQNPGCERRIFCQRLNEVAQRHARETKRFGEILQLLGHAMGGRPGERLSARLGLSVSDDTLLRRVKRWAQLRPPIQRITALGLPTNCQQNFEIGRDTFFRWGRCPQTPGIWRFVADIGVSRGRRCLLISYRPLPPTSIAVSVQKYQ
jgi:hypothetical protein